MSNSRVSLEYFKKHGFPVSIPSNIEIDTLLLEYPLLTVPNPRDNILYILSIIKNNRSYTLLHSKLLQKFSRHYDKVILWLRNRGIIECDGIYKKGLKPFGYRYSFQYLTELREERILKSTLIQRIYNAKEQSRKDYLTKLTLKSDLYGYEPIWLTSKTLASILGLMPTNMLKGLRTLGALKSHLETINPNFDLYKYDYHYINGDYRPKLYFNEDALDYIAKLSIEYPEFFLKVKKAKKSRKSTNI